MAIPQNSFYTAFAPKGSRFGAPKRKRTTATKTGVISSNVPQRTPVTAPAVSASAATAPQGFTPPAPTLPPDPAYQQQLASLGQSRDDQLLALTGERQRGLSDYGYSATLDPSGNVTGVAFDPNNPYSRAALLRKSYQQAKAGNTNSYAAAGQLYAGSLVNAQNTATDRFQQSDDALQKALVAFLANNQAQVNAVKNAYETGAGEALADSIGRIPDNPLYSPAPPAAPAPAPVPQGSSSKALGKDYKVVVKNGKVYHFYPDGRKVYVRPANGS